MLIHLKKLSVGSEDVASLVRWQETQKVDYHGQEAIARTTRNRPRQEKELLNGGSIYWIINRRIQCRQEILGLEQEKDETGRPYCVLMLSPQMIRTQTVPHKPFQGWRYLQAEAAPKDLGPVQTGSEEQNPPPEDMAKELKLLGLID